jgi:hypothetical protein
VSLAWKIAERGRLGTIVRLRSTKYCRYSFTLAGLPRRFSVTLMIGASALGSAAQPFWGSRGSHARLGIRCKYCILDSGPSCSTCAICKSIILPLCSALLCSVLFCSNVIMSAVPFSCPHVTQMRILRGQRAVNIRALAEGNLLLELPYRHAFMGGWSLRFEAHALGGAGTTVLYLSDPPIETDDKPRQPAFVMVRYQKRTFVVASAAGLDQCECRPTTRATTTTRRKNSPLRELTSHDSQPSSKRVLSQ